MTVSDIHRIREETDITACLSLEHDECLNHFGIDYQDQVRHAERQSLVMVRCPMRDFDTLDMRRHLPRSIVALGYLLASGHSVYVHCTSGFGRSPLVVLGYLTLVEGYASVQAGELIQSRRPGASPNWEAYNGCCQDLVERHRERIELRARELHEQGVNGDALRDWQQSETDTIRESLRECIWGASTVKPEESPLRLGQHGESDHFGPARYVGAASMEGLLAALVQLDHVLRTSDLEASSLIKDMHDLEGLTQGIQSARHEGRPRLHVLSAPPKARPQKHRVA